MACHAWHARCRVHAYFNVDWRLVWLAALEKIPSTREAIAAILAAEFPPPDAV